jgi:hypothetical protein
VYGKANQPNTAGYASVIGIKGEVTSIGTTGVGAQTFAGYFDNKATGGAKDYGLYVNTTNDAASVPLSVNVAGVEKLRVDVAGNVGIGTTTPSLKLDVAGSIKIAGNSDACNATNVGAIHYNTAISKHEGCNGAIWNALY